MVIHRPWEMSAMPKVTRILIAYDSATGNTEKMALAVAEGVRSVKGTDVQVKRASAVKLEELLDSDAIIVGSPAYYGQMSASVKALFDKSFKIHGKLEGKVGAAFTSAGGTATGAETTLLSILEAMLVHGMIIRGRSADKHYGAAALEAPDREAKTLCRELGKRTAELARRLKA